MTALTVATRGYFPVSAQSVATRGYFSTATVVVTPAGGGDLGDRKTYGLTNKQKAERRLLAQARREDDEVVMFLEAIMRLH